MTEYLGSQNKIGLSTLRALPEESLAPNASRTVASTAKHSKSRSVGIIGIGEIVAKAHLPVLLAMESVVVSWITDLDSDKGQTIARAYKVPFWKLSNDLTKLPTADVVLLAIPYGARQPYYNELRIRQSALYIEKPFARTVMEHHAITSGYADYRIACGYQRRSWGPTLMVKELLEAGILGSLRSIRYGWGGAGPIVTGGRYNSSLSLAGGGILFESGVHGIDTVLFCTNTLSVELKSAFMIMDGGLDVHTDAELILSTKKGERVDCQLTVSCLRPTINRLEFVFDHVVLSYSLFSEEQIVLRSLDGGTRYVLTQKDGQRYPLTVLQTLHEHWCLFFDGIDKQDANWTAASQSLLTTELIEKLYAAGTSSAPIESR